MKKIRFPGFARIAVMITQICAVLPLPYILIGTGMIGFYMKRGFSACLFDFGMSAIHRAWLFCVSELYALTKTEVAVYFALMIPALVIGFVAVRMLRGKRQTRIAATVIIIAVNAVDLVLRLLPLRVNGVFGIGYDIAGAAVRAVCLALAVVELVKIVKAKNKE